MGKMAWNSFVAGYSTGICVVTSVTGIKVGYSSLTSRKSKTTV